MPNGKLLMAALVLIAASGLLVAGDEPKGEQQADTGGPPMRFRGGTRPWQPPTTRPGLGRPRRTEALTPEQVEETLAFMKKRRPSYYEHLMRIKEDNPRRFRNAIGAMYGFLRRWRNVPEEVREAAIREKDAQVQILLLVRELRQTDDPARKAQLTERLRQSVAEHFQAEQTLQEHQLAHLEDQIKRLRADLADRKQQRDRLIEDRVQRWLTAPPRGGPSSRRGPHTRPGPPEAEPPQ